MNKNYKLKIKNLFMAARLSVSFSRVSVLSGVLKRHKKFVIYLFLIVVLVSTSFVLLTRSSGNKTDAAWFDYSWQNRQRLTFTNSGSQINADRKVKFEIDTSTLVSNGKLQSNCADIRFTDVTGKLLDYFIDTAQGDCNTASTHFYVKLSKIISGDQSIYVYYGNPGAASVQKNDFFADTTLGEGLVGYWPMEDKVSGNGQTIYDYAGVNNGTTSDANATGMDCTVSGKVGNACDFDGVDDYVNTQLTLSTIQTVFTACVWGQYDQITTGYAWLVGEDTGGTNTDHFILGKSGTAGTTHYRFNSFTGSGVNNSLPIDDGGWHQLCYTYDGAVGKYYFDGADTGSTNNGTANFANSGTLQIGRRNFASENWGGLIDEVRIYSRALTATEVSQIYNAGSGSTINVPLTFTPNSTSTASEETGPGPVLYLSFDEGQGTTAYDKSGKGNNGTISGATWQSEDKCISGKCLYFDGSGDYVGVTDSSSLSITSSISISAWVKVNSLPSDAGAYPGLVCKGDHTTGFCTNIYSGPGQKNFMFFTNGAYSGNNAAGNLATSKWHYMTAVYDEDAGYRYLYVDGKQVDSDAYSSGITDGNQQIRIGSDAGSRYFNGFIDEVKIYPFALTAAQVKSDYTAKGGGVKGLTAYVNDDKYKSLNDGLVGYWPMEDGVSGDAQTITDASGNGNNGTTVDGANDTGMDCTVSGKFGTACEFDGTDDNIEIADFTGNFFQANSYTISTWFNSNVSTSRGLLSFGSDGYSPAMLEIRFGGLRSEGFSSSNEAVYRVEGGTHQVGVWQLATVTVDKSASIARLYLNGELITTSSVSGILDSSSQKLTIGKHYWDGVFDGAIDDVRIYNRALTPAEVQNLYEWAPGPVAHYAMDDGVQGAGQTIVDSSGNGNNGTTSSANGTGMDCTVQGQYGGACEFDGVDDYVEIAGNAVINPSQFTLSYWVYNDGQSGGGFRRIVSKTLDHFEVGVNASNLVFYYPSWTETGYTLPVNEWVHMTWVDDGTNIYLYVDGVQKYTAVTSFSLQASDEWQFGLRSNGGGEGFNGALDDVRIYNYALTPKQIRNIMNARPVDAAAIGSPLGSPIAHYTFDEGYGTTAYDSVGGYNGTFGGATNPAWVGGKFGKALDFTATTGNDGSRVSYTGDDLDIGTNTGDELTLSMWLKPDASQTNPSAYFIRNGWGADENYGFLIRELSGGLYKIRMEYYDGAFRSITSTNRIVPAGEWSHLVIEIIQGTSVSYYVNGEFKETVSWIGNSSVSSNSTFNIGGHAGTTNQSYDGLIDDVKIYNYALTPDEIAQDYNQSSRLVLGSASTESNGASASNSSDRTYCVPGDTATCDPPVFEMTFDQQKVSGAGQTIYDTSGNGNNGTTSSANGTGMNCSVAGKVGNACEFDGVDDYVSIVDNAIVRFTENDPFSVFTWLYVDNPDYSNSYEGAVNKRFANDRYWILVDSDGKIDVDLGDGTNVLQAKSNTVINEQEWVYTGFVYDGANTLKLYVNGVLEDTQTTPTLSGLDTTGAALEIGRETTNNRYFNGSIDQVRIYDYARTPAQIAWEYNQGAPVAWYKFDECQGTTIYDWSENANGQSNGNHGTLNIGASGTQTSAGTCSSGTSTQAWSNGTTGKWGSAISFDGTDDYFCVDTNNDSSCDDVSHLDITGAMSVSAWVKTTASAGAIVSKDGVADPSWELRIDSNTEGGRPGFMVDSGDVDITGPFKVNDGVWHHLLVTFEPSVAAKMYVDGIYVAQESPTNSSLINNSQSLYIGARPYAHALRLNGLIDDVRIYNYALTPEQVKSVYNDGAVNFR